MTVRQKSFVAARRRRCREQLAQQGLDALVVLNPPDVTYLTGFEGDDSVLVLTARRGVLVTDSRYVVQARRECPRLPLRDRGGLSLAEAVAAVLAPLGGRRALRVAIEADHVTVSQHRAYRRELGRGLRAIKPLLAPLRQCKDDGELRHLRQAVRIAQEAMTSVRRWVRPPLTERQMAARLEYEMSRRGSTHAAFPTIVAFGAHAAEPHAVPGPACLRAGQSVLFDWGATVSGYRSDLTRCYVSGRIRPAFADAYRWVLEAQAAAIAEVKAGQTIAQVDVAARKVLRRSGLPLYGHGTGHGLGLDVHEQPRINARNQDELREGMVVTIEPAVYLPGRFGIRIEDDVLVGKRGAAVLSTLPKDLGAVAW